MESKPLSRSMLVLVVDDDSEDSEIFCAALESIDPKIEFIVQTNGVDAIEYLNQRINVGPDFIFLDVNMPKMNGIECLKAIKANPTCTNVPVIMYSTTQSPTEIQFFKTLGAQFLQKPSTIKDLDLVLKKILSQKLS